MRARIIGIAAIAAALIVAAAGVRTVAEATVSSLTSTSVVCPPPNLDPADVSCGTGYVSVRAETESATAVYFGGSGLTGANRATVGLKRCTTCNNGTAFNPDVIRGQLKCTSDGASDAGVTVAVLCGQ